MAGAAPTGELIQVVSLLGAGVVAVPVFRKLGLGSVLGYFAAGLAIGPFGLRLFDHPETILRVAEFGIIMLLFIIGLEMQPARLWNLRRSIFGLGLAQVLVCGALLTVAGMLAGLAPAVAFVAGMGFVLSSTAVVMQILEERGETATPQGQKAVSILLLEDLAIVPLLAIVAFIAPGGQAADAQPRWLEMLSGIGAIVGVIFVGRWLLNPMFSVLAAARAREVMTAAALLVVLGAALLMQLGGLSMALGAFLAGVLLSESTFRHQLEADIEPFRGILLGLFFLAVGMSLDLAVIAARWPVILAATAGYVAVKALGIYAVARALGARNRDAVTRVSLFAQGGEFAFVLYAAATAAGVLTPEFNAIFTAAVIISMALTPIMAPLVARLMPPEEVSLDGVDAPDGLDAKVLVIGFGRFGQVVSQPLLARGYDISLIETDVDLIRVAEKFGFRVYYGDGTRIDILHASGADKAEAILVCVDNRETADRITAIVKQEFPLAKLFVRAYDRGHALDLIRAGVDYQVRETVGSATTFSRAVLRELGVPDDEAEEIMDDVRRRDEERFELQMASDIYAGADLLRRNTPTPAPLTKPRRIGKVFGAEPAVATPAAPPPARGDSV